MPRRRSRLRSHRGARHPVALLCARISESERIWEGRSQAPGESIDGLNVWLQERYPRPVIRLGAPPAMVDLTHRDAQTIRVREHFKHARRPKDGFELARLRQAAACTAAGFGAIRAQLGKDFRPTTERSLQVTLESAFFTAGARQTGYGTIVGSGSNAAILHFDPSDRQVAAGEFVLIDAGAEIDRYVCDVTRPTSPGVLPRPSSATSTLSSGRWKRRRSALVDPTRTEGNPFQGGA